MSDLAPLSFPSMDQATHTTDSAFPYTSIDAPTQVSPQINRMQQLESMLKEVQGRAEIVEKEAYDKAYLAGEKAGLALGRKRGEQILEALQESLQEAETDIEYIQQSFAEAAIDVAKHIAENIVGEIISQDISNLLDIARQAASQLPDHTGLRIAVSPDDFSSFKRLFEAPQSQAPQSNDSTAISTLCRDATVDSGTCRIISSQQDILIDPIAAVSNHLKSLRPALLKPTAFKRSESKALGSNPSEPKPSEPKASPPQPAATT